MKDYLVGLILLGIPVLLGVYIGATTFPKTIIKTEVKEVIKEVETPAPELYLCDNNDLTDVSGCFIVTNLHSTYCFDNHCSYIYTEEDFK